ncbi:MAG TPA: DUF3048 domain-containing protein, partial [Clostridia bacterium]|nr:DUF3048 domain-containing protein [Clostridia bacterium]
LLILAGLLACGQDLPPPESSLTQPPTMASPTSSRPRTSESRTTVSLPPPPPQTHYLFADRYPIAFMINNTAAARPQSGLSKAKLIYQMLTEGRTTRLLLITDESEGVIGPVRSARPAFLDLVAQERAFYAYAGNYRVIEPSPVVKDIRILDALKGDYDIYYRTSHRVSPHNLYTSLEKAYKRAERRYESIHMEGAAQGLQAYQDFLLPQGGQANLKVSYRYSSLQESFVYQADVKAYHKYNKDQVLVDEATGDRLEVVNILIIHRPHSLMPNGVHNKINWVDQGQAVYLTGGRRYDVTWEKTSHTSPIQYFLEEEALVLNPGLTWILVLDGQALKTLEYEPGQGES